MQPSEPPILTLSRTDLASKLRLIPANTPQLTVVSSTTVAGQCPTLSPPTSDWSAIQTIVNTNASYEDRLKAIASLSGHLTDSDWEELQPFLLKPDPLDQSQLGQVIKNQLLDLLCALNPPPAGLGGVLTQIYGDQQQNEVIRDYAVQHMAAYYEQMTGQHDHSGTLQSVQKILWEAVNEPVGSIGGTALLALKRLSQEYTNNFDEEKIAAAALQMADNPIAGELTHITAYQVCGELEIPGALPVVLQAAQTGETIPVRLSAIGALGHLGGPDQIPYLNSVLEEPEDRLKPAANHALAQIMARQNPMASRQ